MPAPHQGAMMTTVPRSDGMPAAIRGLTTTDGDRSMIDDATSSSGGTPVGTAAEVVRSEEQLSVTYRSEEIGRVRISKRVITEERVIKVTLRREELVVEPTPTDGNRQGSLISEQSSHGSLGTDADSSPVAEIWLSEEEVEVVTRVVPRERVRVHVNTITESLHVQEALAREVVDVETDETTVDHSTR